MTKWYELFQLTAFPVFRLNRTIFFYRLSLLIKEKSIDTRPKSRRFSFVLISTFKNPRKLSVSSHRSFVLDLSISLSSSVELTELGHNFRRNFLPVTTVRRNLRAFSLKSLARGFPSVRNHLKDHGYHRQRDTRTIFIQHSIFVNTRKRICS